MPPPYTAQLRVYEPLAAFSGTEQRRWRAYLNTQRPPSADEALAAERVLCLPSVVALRLPARDAEQHAYVSEVDGIPVLCPWSLRRRMAGAALQAVDGVAPVVANALVPEPLLADARRVAAERDHPAESSTHQQDHVVAAPWAIPVRWFGLFDADDRELVLTEGQRMLRYRTQMADARRRMARGLAVLRRTLGDIGVVSSVESLARWLEEFHPRSLVELDYGGLVHLMTDEEMTEDTSAADVAAVLAAMGEHDTDGASEAYERVTARWRTVHLAERAN